MTYLQEPRKPVTLTELGRMRGVGEKIAVLTCYDASFAALVDRCGVDVALACRGAEPEDVVKGGRGRHGSVLRCSNWGRLYRQDSPGENDSIHAAGKIRAAASAALRRWAGRPRCCRPPAGSPGRSGRPGGGRG